MREEGLGKPEKLLEIHKKLIPKAYSWFTF